MSANKVGLFSAAKDSINASLFAVTGIAATINSVAEAGVLASSSWVKESCLEQLIEGYGLSEEQARSLDIGLAKDLMVQAETSRFSRPKEAREARQQLMELIRAAKA